MGQRIGWHRNKSAARLQLIDEVERLARARNEPHILVFDAAPKSAVPDKRSRPLLTIRYARAGSSADELILELVYCHKREPELLAVTSDRALARQIQVLGAAVMRSGVFRRILEQTS